MTFRTESEEVKLNFVKIYKFNILSFFKLNNTVDVPIFRINFIYFIEN